MRNCGNVRLQQDFSRNAALVRPRARHVSWMFPLSDLSDAVDLGLQARFRLELGVGDPAFLLLYRADEYTVTIKNVFHLMPVQKAVATCALLQISNSE